MVIIVNFQLIDFSLSDTVSIKIERVRGVFLIVNAPVKGIRKEDSNILKIITIGTKEKQNLAEAFTFKSM